MVAMGRGGGKTPERVVKLINDEIAKIGQNATARAVGLPLYSIQKYMKGLAEPSQATLEKLSEYFGKSVPCLRGDDDLHENYDLEIKTKDVFGRIDNWDHVRGFAIHEIIQLMEQLETKLIIDLVMQLRKTTGYAAMQEYQKDKDGDYSAIIAKTSKLETTGSGRNFKPLMVSKTVD